MKRWTSLLLAVFVIAALILSACAAPTAAPAPAGGEAAAPAGGTTMTFWTRDSNQEQVRKLVDAWNTTHENQIEVTVIPAGDYMTKVGASVGAGAPPDLMAVDLIYVPQFAAVDQLTDITDLAKALPYFDKLSPSHVRLATYDDKIFGLPFNAEGSFLMYNKGLFKEAGLDPEKPPTTWAEIADAAKKITALGNDNYGYYFSGACAGCNAFTYLPLMWASGGDVLNADSTAATLTDPASSRRWSSIDQMWADGSIPAGAQADTGTDFANAFTTGKIGMVGTGRVRHQHYQDQLPGHRLRRYVPAGQEGGQSSFAGGDSIAIPPVPSTLRKPSSLSSGSPRTKCSWNSTPR